MTNCCVSSSGVRTAANPWWTQHEATYAAGSRQTASTC